jgi:hypothetical protein
MKKSTYLVFQQDIRMNKWMNEEVTTGILAGQMDE